MIARGSRPALALLAALALATALARPARADGEREGKIDTAHDQLDHGDRVRDHREQPPDEADEDDDEEIDADNPIVTLSLYVLSSPFWGPPIAVDDQPFPRAFRFAPYPFHDGARTGCHRMTPAGGALPGWQVSLRTAASYERHFDGIEGRRLRLSLRTNQRFDLDGELTRLDEEVADGVDQLWHGKGVISYSFAVSPRVHFDSGLGVRVLRFADGDTEVGVLWRYQAEFLPLRPLHLWFSGELGGSGAGAAGELEAGVGLLFYRAEAFVALRHFAVAGVGFSGPAVGLAVWL